MKAFLIDPVARTVTPHNVESWRDIAPALNCDLFDAVYLTPTTTVYVDDEGLYVPDQHFFMFVNGHQALAGRGLVLGVDPETGDSIDCPLTLDQIESHLHWLGRRQP